MSFNSALPDDRVNVSERSVAREALLLVAGVCGLGAALVVGLALAIEVVIPRVPASLERLIAAAWFDLETDDDPRALRAQALTDRLRRHWPECELDFRVAIIESEAPNAMALPGGLILITSELMDAVRSENELAFVLAHELGHFRNRDHLRGLGRGATRALVFAVLGLGDGAAGLLGTTVGSLAERSFGRQQEYEADRFGLELIGREYGHAGGAIEVFERLLRSPDAENDPKPGQRYFDSHPGNPERIDALRAEATRQNLGFPDTRVPWIQKASPQL